MSTCRSMPLETHIRTCALKLQLPTFWPITRWKKCAHVQCKCVLHIVGHMACENAAHHQFDSENEFIIFCLILFFEIPRKGLHIVGPALGSPRRCNRKLKKDVGSRYVLPPTTNGLRTTTTSQTKVLFFRESNKKHRFLFS